MCGLYGFVGNHPRKSEILRALCVVNSERGDHSAGIARIAMKNGKKSVKIYKKAGHPIPFANSQQFKDITKFGVVHIGHTRFATTGEKTDDNAHPFWIGDTVGAHNGCVGNLHEVKRFLKEDMTKDGKEGEYEVDSQYLIHLINRHGNVSPAKGSLTVTYHKLDSNVMLNIMRFGNTIHIMGDETENWIAYSSSQMHLYMAMGMVDIEVSHQYELKDKEQIEVYIKDDKVKLKSRDTCYNSENWRTTTNTNSRSSYYPNHANNPCSNPGRGGMDAENYHLTRD